ncbi:MAG: tetratricopeptide repeat protein [Burkholderiaceae bacterium]|jgi:predicted negative regulator of RcsB-dependent stress response|nr:tetratricopeptide repeat protein [Burkholderiaceae bacterium]
MAIQIQNLDLEEQEQLEQIKHLWNKWGNLITWVLIVVLGAYAAWNGWQYWQRRQAAQASVLWGELERAATAGETARVTQSLGDLQSRFGGTWYAAQGALLAAKTLADKGQNGPAMQALAWAADKGGDAGLRAVARLRLASLQMGEKAYDDAAKTLAASFPPAFEALAADRRGDLLMLQGKREQAVTEYGKAYQGMEPDSGDYRRLVGIKLNALGIDPDAKAASAKPAGAS